MWRGHLRPGVFPGYLLALTAEAGASRLTKKAPLGGERGSYGKGDRDYLRSRGCWERGGLFKKTPLLHVPLRLCPAIIVCKRSFILLQLI